MKMSDIKDLSDEQLVHTELSLERKLINSRIKKSFGTLDSSASSKIRKDIARIQTEVTMRQKLQVLSKNAFKGLYAKTFVAEQLEDTNNGDFLKGIADKLS